MGLATNGRLRQAPVGCAAGGVGSAIATAAADGAGDTGAMLAGADESRIARLITAARGGDATALGELLVAVRKYLVFIAKRRLPSDLGPHFAPSDLAQETAIEAHVAFGGFRGSTVPEFLTWIRVILLNNVTDAVRRSRSYDRAVARAARRSSAPGLPADEQHRSPTVGRPPEASAIRRDEAQFVERILAGLSADSREVVRLRYWDGLTFPDIGKRLGRSENAVRKTWHRAISRLQEEIRRSRARSDAEGRAGS